MAGESVFKILFRAIADLRGAVDAQRAIAQTGDAARQAAVDTGTWSQRLGSVGKAFAGGLGIGSADAVIGQAVGSIMNAHRQAEALHEALAASGKAMQQLSAGGSMDAVSAALSTADKAAQDLQRSMEGFSWELAGVSLPAANLMMEALTSWKSPLEIAAERGRALAEQMASMAEAHMRSAAQLQKENDLILMIAQGREEEAATARELLGVDEQIARKREEISRFQSQYGDAADTSGLEREILMLEERKELIEGAARAKGADAQAAALAERERRSVAERATAEKKAREERARAVEEAARAAAEEERALAASRAREAVLKAELAGNSALAAQLATRASYEERITAARDAGQDELADQLSKERDLALAKEQSGRAEQAKAEAAEAAAGAADTVSMERDKLAVMQAQLTQGQAIADALAEELDYRGRIAKATEDGNLELAEILHKQQELSRLQAAPYSGAEQRAADSGDVERANRMRANRLNHEGPNGWSGLERGASGFDSLHAGLRPDTLGLDNLTPQTPPEMPPPTNPSPSAPPASPSSNTEGSSLQDAADIEGGLEGAVSNAIGDLDLASLELGEGFAELPPKVQEAVVGAVQQAITDLDLTVIDTAPGFVDLPGRIAVALQQSISTAVAELPLDEISNAVEVSIGRLSDRIDQLASQIANAR